MPTLAELEKTYFKVLIVLKNGREIISFMDKDGLSTVDHTKTFREALDEKSIWVGLTPSKLGISTLIVTSEIASVQVFEINPDGVYNV